MLIWFWTVPVPIPHTVFSPMMFCVPHAFEAPEVEAAAEVVTAFVVEVTAAVVLVLAVLAATVDAEVVAATVEVEATEVVDARVVVDAYDVVVTALVVDVVTACVVLAALVVDAVQSANVPYITMEFDVSLPAAVPKLEGHEPYVFAFHTVLLFPPLLVSLGLFCVLVAALVWNPSQYVVLADIDKEMESVFHPVTRKASEVCARSVDGSEELCPLCEYTERRTLPPDATFTT